MKEWYDLNQLAMISGLSTRTLRNYIHSGVLNGEKTDGAWRFTPEEIAAFMDDEAVKRSVAAHHNGVVLDFMADAYKRANRACLMLDLAVNREEAEEASAFFCDAINRHGRDIRFCCRWEKQLFRVILSGAEDQVVDLMREYYGEGKA